MMHSPEAARRARPERLDRLPVAALREGRRPQGPGRAGRRRRDVQPDDLPGRDRRGRRLRRPDPRAERRATTIPRRSSGSSPRTTSATPATSCAPSGTRATARTAGSRSRSTRTSRTTPRRPSPRPIRLHELVDRPNLFIKIPATVEGLQAIEDTIAAGIPVNVTLIFSLERHRKVTEAYVRGVQRFVDGGGDPAASSRPSRSFFVSRVDTEADKRLDEIGGHDELKGKLAIANAKLAYQNYQEVFSTPEWQALEAKGATKQRCLWASTGVKNPDYKDTVYVEELVGPDTVNTMPRELVEAVDDHGEIRGDTLLEDVDEASRILDAFEAAGRQVRRRRRGAREGGRGEVRQVLRRPDRGPGEQAQAGGGVGHGPRRRLPARARAAAAGGLRPRVGRRRLGPPHLLDVRRRPDGRPDRRPPAAGLHRPEEPGQRPPDLLQGPRLAAVLRGPEGRRRDRRRGAADVPQARLAAGGSPDAAHPADRRRHRLARPGPADRRRRGDGRPLAGQAALPRVGAVRRLRDGRGLDVGGLPARRLGEARQPHRDHRRQPPRPDARDDARLGPRRLRPPHRGVRLEGDRDRRPRRRGDRGRLRRGREHRRPAGRDRRPDQEGQGRRRRSRTSPASTASRSTIPRRRSPSSAASAT